MPATTDTQSATFLSKHRGLVLRRVSRMRATNAMGQDYIVQEGVKYQFTDGRLTVKAGQDMLPDGPVDPETGEQTVQDAIGWLRGHSHFNAFGLLGCFHEEGKEPGRIPEPDAELERVMGLLSELDVDGLRGLLEEERAGYARRPVLVAAERAIERVEGALEALAAQGADGPDGGDGAGDGAEDGGTAGNAKPRRGRGA